MLYETRKNKNPDEERPRTETSGTQTRNYSVQNNPNPYADRVQSLEKQGAPTYTQSPEVSSLKNKWQQTESSKPQNFSYANQGVIQQLTDQILNRKPFTYDVNADPLYQQYKDSYMHNGRLAMMDTTAQMSGLTGGYGNSYAASAGNQAYQGYLTQLNNVIPELYEAAYNRSLREEENMRNNLAMLENQKNFDYGIYRDQMGDWKENRNFDYGAYIDASERDYGRHRDQVGDYYTDLGNAYGRYDQDNADYMWGEQMNENAHQYDKNFSYQELRDAIADSQWQQSFAYQKEQDDIARERADKQLELEDLKYKSGDSTIQAPYKEMSMEEYTNAIGGYAEQGDAAGMESMANQMIYAGMPEGMVYEIIKSYAKKYNMPDFKYLFEDENYGTKIEAMKKKNPQTSYYSPLQKRINLKRKANNFGNKN